MSSSAVAAPARPNIIVILADDLGFSDIGCYGSEVPTPNLDKRAAEGVRFTQFLHNTPRCSPTRAAIMTGLYPHQAGMGWLDGKVEPNSLALSWQAVAATTRDDGRGAPRRWLFHSHDRQMASRPAKRHAALVARLHALAQLTIW